MTANNFGIEYLQNHAWHGINQIYTARTLYPLINDVISQQFT